MDCPNGAYNWRTLDKLIQLEKGDVLIVQAVVFSANDNPTKFEVGTKCRFIEVDKDGDPIISTRIRGCLKKVPIFRHEFGCFDIK